MYKENEMKKAWKNSNILLRESYASRRASECAKSITEKLFAMAEEMKKNAPWIKDVFLRAVPQGAPGYPISHCIDGRTNSSAEPTEWGVIGIDMIKLGLLEQSGDYIDVDDFSLSYNSSKGEWEDAIISIYDRYYEEYDENESLDEQKILDATQCDVNVVFFNIPFYGDKIVALDGLIDALRDSDWGNIDAVVESNKDRANAWSYGPDFYESAYDANEFVEAVNMADKRNIKAINVAICFYMNPYTMDEFSGVLSYIDKQCKVIH